MLRLLTPHDALALQKFWNAAACYDVASLDLLQEQVWEDPDFSSDLALVEEDAGQIVAFGLGILRPSKIGYIKMLAVAETHRKQGLASLILNNLEEKLWALGAERIRAGEAPPVYFMPGIEVRYTAALVFFQKHGYTKFHEGYHLFCDLMAENWETVAEEQALAQRQIEIRRANPADEASVMAFLAEHFLAWQYEVAQTFKNKPLSLHLALKAGKVVGFSAYDAGHRSLPWFGPMGTDPQQRGLGVGAVLLRRCLRDQKAGGHAYSVIPWVGPYPFYARYANAWIDRVFWRYEKLRKIP